MSETRRFWSRQATICYVETRMCAFSKQLARQKSHFEQLILKCRFQTKKRCKINSFSDSETRTHFRRPECKEFAILFFQEEFIWQNDVSSAIPDAEAINTCEQKCAKGRRWEFMGRPKP